MYLFNYVRYHVMQLSKDLDQGQFCPVAIVWAIWKAQCDQVYQGNSQAPQFVLNSAISMHQMGESHTKRQLAAETSMAELTGQLPAANSQLPGTICTVDGSFHIPDQGGMGYVIHTNNVLVQYGVGYYVPLSPFQRGLGVITY